MGGLQSRIADLEAENQTLKNRNIELQSRLDVEQVQRQELDNEIARLRAEMEQQLQEYQDLMDIKISLDMELAAYDKLLAGEEQRLNISKPNSANSSLNSANTPVHQHHHRSGRITPSISMRSSVGPSSKRKRTLLDESEDRSVSDFSVTSSAKGEIEFGENDPTGKFVKLHNKSNDVR